MDRLSIAMCVFLLSACAARPERIAASHVEIAPASCAQLAFQRERDEARLLTAYEDQRSVRRSDTWGLILIGMPVGRMTEGSHAQEIAQLKGEIAAIDEASVTCR